MLPRAIIWSFFLNTDSNHCSLEPNFAECKSTLRNSRKGVKCTEAQRTAERKARRAGVASNEGRQPSGKRNERNGTVGKTMHDGEKNRPDATEKPNKGRKMRKTKQRWTGWKPRRSAHYKTGYERDGPQGEQHRTKWENDTDAMGRRVNEARRDAKTIRSEIVAGLKQTRYEEGTGRTGKKRDGKDCVADYSHKLNKAKKL